MACDHCHRAGYPDNETCECTGGCQECQDDLKLAAAGGLPPEETEAGDQYVDAFLEANPGLESILRLPGVYPTGYAMESVPGVLEVTPVPLEFETVHGHWKSSQPNAQNLVGNASAEAAVMVVADVFGNDVVLQKTWDKSAEAPISPFAGAGLSIAEQLQFTLFSLTRDLPPASAEFKEAVEKVAGPCHIEVYGFGVRILRRTPNPDGNYLEILVEY